MQLVKRLIARLHPAADDPVREVVARIKQLGIFDAEQYVKTNPDVAAAGVDPVLHYATRGVWEGRKPCRYFDTAYYCRNNPDVMSSGMNPLLHYFEFGWKEGRNPSADFDAKRYAASHLSESARAANPLLHYLTIGHAKGLEVSPVSDPEMDLIRESGVFDSEYYLEKYPDIAELGGDPIAHYLKHGASEGRNPSAMFDTRYYLANNPDVKLLGVNPLVHFCASGWKELRNPSRDFDVWWYWSTYLDPAVEGLNPLGHYQTAGRFQALDTKPARSVSQLAGRGYRHPAGQPVRRICLFAGHDKGGIVDDYVVAYVRELGRHADVYYFADCDMRPGELDKLNPYVKRAWAEEHGQYDFGSYAQMIRRIGWGAIESYDELLLVNDSCYLLRELDEVFLRMNRRACDWWGLQATKGIASTRKSPSNQFRQPIAMDTVRRSLLDSFECDYQYDFLVGSYFLAYRPPVIYDASFRRMLESVVAQDSKKNLVLKYEVGFTRHLIARRYAFDTFIDSLYPFHPIFTNWYFRLLDEGFPLLKRYLLSENHYAIPRLYDWADRVRQKVPDADIETIQRNLDRVVDPARLYRNLHIGSRQEAVDIPVAGDLLDDEAFIAADQACPKHANWWAFPVCAFTGVFSGNERAVFEQVRDDPLIRKIVLTKDKPVEVDGVNVEVVPLNEPIGQHRLMHAGNIFIKHSPTRNLIYPVAPDLHNIINLWHGIPFKRIGYASEDMQDRLDLIAAEHAKCRAVICSSKIDALAMSAAFYPLSYSEVWNVGLPRNDFILRETDRLPVEMQQQTARLETLLRGRRLVLFMPTFRNEQANAYYSFNEGEVEFLRSWLSRNNAVLGIREHMADSARVYSRQLAQLQTLDLSIDMFPHVEVLYRASDVLITDYSSSFIDYMLTGKPAVSFAYDYHRYLEIERGSFYDLDFVFPGPVCRDFSEFADALENVFAPLSAVDAASLEWKRRMFFDYLDDQSAARLVTRVKQLTDCGGVGKSFNSGLQA